MTSSYGNRQKHESKNPVQRALIARFTAQTVRLARSIRPRTVLEVGCGEGYMLDALARANLGADLLGIDISESAVVAARARLGDRAEVEVRDALDLVNEHRQFDLVVMLEVLEHLTSPERMLPVLAQLAAHHVLLSVPWEPFFRGLNFARGKHLRAWGNDPEHVNHWGRRQFVEWVGRQFAIRETPMVFPWTMVLAEPRSSADSGNGPPARSQSR